MMQQFVDGLLLMRPKTVGGERVARRVRTLDGDGAELGGGEGRERAEEGADGRAGDADDADIPSLEALVAITSSSSRARRRHDRSMGWSYPNKEAGGEDASLPPAMSDERTQESCESETEKRGGGECVRYHLLFRWWWRRGGVPSAE